MIEQPLVALSLTQPWAWLVIHGPKDIENRVWHLPRSMVGRVAYIHAAKGMRKADYESAYDTAEEIGGPSLADSIPRVEDLVRGAIIGVARFTECICPRMDVPLFGEEVPWHFLDQHGFRLEERKALAKPVPCKGALGFWRVPDDVRALAEASW